MAGVGADDVAVVDGAVVAAPFPQAAARAITVPTLSTILSARIRCSAAMPYETSGHPSEFRVDQQF